MSEKSTRLERLRQELIGIRFGQLIVLCDDGKNRHGQTLWRCVCDCGGHTLTYSTFLKNGHTRSCGCLVRGAGGWSGTPEYRTWRNMLARCYNPKNNRFASYGGRGIAVCGRWRRSIDAFAEDMGRCPPGCSIDRVNNDQDYEPGNCRWATSRQQSRNTSRNVILSHDGLSMTLTDWAERTGIPFRLLHQRIRAGWATDDALARPPKKYTRR
jgi:hypothetical protein